MDNSTPMDSELLVRYLDGELDDAAKAELEHRIARDKHLADDLESLQLAREAVHQYAMRNRVAAIHTEMTGAKGAVVRKLSSTRVILRYSMAVAAGILLLVGIFVTFYFFNLSADKLYASNYQPYEISTLRGSGDDDSLFQAFRNRNYSEVINMHERRGDSSVLSSFLAGVSHLQLNNFANAITDLENVVTTNKKSASPVFTDEAEYYLALAYVKNRDFDFALPLLEKINADEEHIYNDKVSRKMIRDVRLLKWR